MAFLRSGQPRLTDITGMDIYGVDRFLKLLLVSVPMVTGRVVEEKITPLGYQLTEGGTTDIVNLLKP